MLSCKCGNVRVRYQVTPGAEDPLEEEVDGKKFFGPLSPALGGVTFEVAALVEEGPKVTRCLNCDMGVFYGSGSSGEAGGYWVNRECLNALPAEASAIFGLVVPEGDATGVRVGDVKLNRLLDAYSVRVREEAEEKIRAFREQMERESDAAIDAATRDARRIWKRVEQVGPRKSTKAKKMATPPVVLEEKAGVSWAPRPSTASPPSSSSSRMGAGRRSPRPRKQVSPVQINFSQSVPTSSKVSVDGSLWAMDEELEEADENEQVNASAWGSGAALDDSDEVTLNVSDSGLLPGAKRLLYGSNEDEKGNSGEKGPSLVMAQSLPVSVPSFRRPGLTKSSSDALRDSSDSEDVFQRPDTLAANTYKEQVRHEWLAQSKLLNASGRDKSEADDDDLDFILATQQQRSVAKSMKSSRGL